MTAKELYDQYHLGDLTAIESVERKEVEGRLPDSFNFLTRRRLIANAAIAAVVLSAASMKSRFAIAAERTFKIWLYSDPTSAETRMWQASIDELKKRHPDVNVEFQLKSFQGVRANGAMVLNSNQAPDVLQFNQGTGDTGFLAKNNLIANLNSYAEKYGWENKVPEGGKFTAKYDQNGVMGSGDWYAVCSFPIFVTVYYSKTEFAKYNLAVPTTLAELEAVMKVFVDHGVTPIALSGGEYPAWQLWYELTLAKADRKFVDDFILFKGDVDFHGPEMTFGAQKMADWIAAGFISKTAASLKNDDAKQAFAAGKAPLLISGSWYSSLFREEIKDFEWGTFAFPGNKLFEGSGGNTLVIPANSEQKDLAAEYLDITLSPEMQSMLASYGNVPITGVTTDVTDAHTKELIEVFNTIQSGLAYWPDMSVPGYDPPMVNAFQSLINGTKTPSEVLDAIRIPYERGVRAYR